MNHDPQDWRHCTNCRTCNQKRKNNWVPQTVYVGIVQGASKDTADVQARRDFDPGLDAYKKARDEGLQPKHSTLRAVADARREVRSHEAALKKLSKVADTEYIRTAAGVER